MAVIADLAVEATILVDKLFEAALEIKWFPYRKPHKTKAPWLAKNHRIV